MTFFETVAGHKFAEYTIPSLVKELSLLREEIKRLNDNNEKQIPKKPIKDREQDIRYTSSYSCPNCGGGFTGTGVANYCYHCGQCLDWEEFSQEY